MILSNADIQKQIDSGDIKINPYYQENIRPSSYCLTLGNEIIRFKDSVEAVSLLDSSTYPKSEKVFISRENPYSISPGEFVLASSFESLSVPNTISGFLSNISGLARLGLNVLLSTHISSGFGLKEKKVIALEIHNVAKHSIELIPNIRICHLIFAKNITPSTQGYDELFPHKYSRNILSEYFKKT